jgi:putative oxidoreductase
MRSGSVSGRLITVNVQTGLKYSGQYGPGLSGLCGIFPRLTDITDRGHFMPLAVHRATIRQWAALPLRLIVGYGFIAHGYAKVMNGPDRFAASLHALGVPAAHSMAWMTIGVELLGGLAVLVGAWIPLVSLPLAVILFVAAITVHLPYGFSSIKLREVTSAGAQFGPPGYETNLLYIAALATLVLGGSGPFAFDRLRAWRAGTRQAQESETDDHARRASV